MATLEMSGDRLLVPADVWLQTLHREYLADYIKSGGSAVKVVSGSEERLNAAVRSIREMAESEHYYYASPDPAQLDANGKRPDLHRIDRFYFAVTTGVAWKEWAAAQARRYLEEKRFTLAPGRRLDDIEGIAQDNGIDDSQELLRQYQREFAAPLAREYGMAVEFRNAISELGRAQLIPNSMTPTTEEVLLEWLAGRTLPGGTAALKSMQIYERINQGNARSVLTSFCHWLPMAGYSGLMVVLDFRPYEYKRVNKATRQAELLRRMQEAIDRGATSQELEALSEETQAEPAAVYSDAAYMQMLTQIRRFIDEIDRFERFLLVILTTPKFYDNLPSRRNYYNYDALQTRIGLEVHDAHRANPAAALVHLGEYER